MHYQTLYNDTAYQANLFTQSPFSFCWGNNYLSEIKSAAKNSEEELSVLENPKQRAIENTFYHFSYVITYKFPDYTKLFDFYLRMFWNLFADNRIRRISCKCHINGSVFWLKCTWRYLKHCFKGGNSFIQGLFALVILIFWVKTCFKGILLEKLKALSRSKFTYSWTTEKWELLMQLKLIK